MPTLYPPVDPLLWPHDGDALNDILTQMVDAAWAGLDNTRIGRPESHGFFHHDVVEDCCDGLYLVIEQWIPTTVSTFPAAITTDYLCKQIEMVPRLKLAVRRPCAQLPDDEGGADPAVEDATAADMNIDFRALTCAVYGTWPDILRSRYPTSKIYYMPADPVGFNTNCFGWDWRMMIGITGCKNGC